VTDRALPSPLLHSCHRGLAALPWWKHSVRAAAPSDLTTGYLQCGWRAGYRNGVQLTRLLLGSHVYYLIGWDIPVGPHFDLEALPWCRPCSRRGGFASVRFDWPALRRQDLTRHHRVSQRGCRGLSIPRGVGFFLGLVFLRLLSPSALACGVVIRYVSHRSSRFVGIGVLRPNFRLVSCLHNTRPGPSRPFSGSPPVSL